MKKMSAKVLSVHLGADDELGKEQVASLQAELDGFVGDRHRSFTRETWKGDKQPRGTVRRNERQWSAISIEELTQIQKDMDLKEPLTASDVGANICLQGLPGLSKLPKGTILKFPSGAELIVEEYNPPCMDMGQKIASTHSTPSGNPVRETAFSKAAEFSRGVVGVVDVPGEIRPGDEVIVELYQQPERT